jgi:Matrixin
MKLRAFLLIIVAELCVCAPLRQWGCEGAAECFRPLDQENVTSMLVKYGYMHVESENEIDDMTKNTDESGENTGDERLKMGLRDLQTFAGLEATGILDQQTQDLLNSPRCGFPDIIRTRTKRFAIQGSKWKYVDKDTNETVVYYYIDLENYRRIDTRLAKQEIQNIFYHAFKKWSLKTLIRFEEVNDAKMSNISIHFLGGKHGDGYDFDFRGGVLAHAFYPAAGKGGDAHFDLAEKWTTYGEEKSISLLHVAIHEIGHSLGLLHSSLKTSIMYPWYKKQFELSENDHIGLNSIYGVRPEYEFGLLDPKYRVSTTTPRVSTTTPRIRSRYRQIERLFIQNSKVYIYPKSATVTL